MMADLTEAELEKLAALAEYVEQKGDALDLAVEPNGSDWEEPVVYIKLVDYQKLIAVAREGLAARKWVHEYRDKFYALYLETFKDFNAGERRWPWPPHDLVPPPPRSERVEPSLTKRKEGNCPFTKDADNG